jgi:nicotinate-nucleotide pyrophosphorylase (carboxylating)
VLLETIALPLVRLALTEDIGGGDATADAVAEPDAAARAHIEARQEGVLAGCLVAGLAFRELDAACAVTWLLPEGSELTRGARVAEISGKARAILSGERVALNFLQHLSGVATLARAFVRAVEGTGVRILDTRKTTPGLRFLEKHAVRVGGAVNHRFGLFDGVLIKENHIRIAGGVAPAMERVRRAGRELPIVIEARTPAQALDAAALKPDRILLDNFTPTAIAEVLKRLGRPRGTRAAGGPSGGPEIEVSGGVRLANVRDFALPGVTYISIGALTHSAPALDFSLLVDGAAPA